MVDIQLWRENCFSYIITHLDVIIFHQPLTCCTRLEGSCGAPYRHPGTTRGGIAWLLLPGCWSIRRWHGRCWSLPQPDRRRRKRWRCWWPPSGREHRWAGPCSDGEGWSSWRRSRYDAHQSWWSVKVKRGIFISVRVIKIWKLHLHVVGVLVIERRVEDDLHSRKRCDVAGWNGSHCWERFVVVAGIEVEENWLIPTGVLLALLYPCVREFKTWEKKV